MSSPPVSSPPVSSPVTGESPVATRDWVGPILLLALVLVGRLVLAGTTGIVEDEAYYWTWSERLAAGYYDHAPGIAWVIAPFAKLFGATSLGVRAGPVLAGTLAVAALLPFARDRWLLVLILASMPLYTLGGVLATPDAPMLAGWALALAGAYRGNWLLAGVGAGLAGLCKYTGWGIWPLLFLGAPRQWRAMLPGVAVTLGLLAPNLLWNAQHDWISVRFQLGHGLGSGVIGAGGVTGATSSTAPGVLGALEFVGAQAGLVSPVLFGAAIGFWTKGWRGDATDRLSWWTSLPVVAFFTLAAMLARGEPNWAAPAWLGVAVGLSRATGRVRRAAWLGAGFGAVLSALVAVHLYMPLVDFPRDPTARLGVGRDLAESVQAWGIEPVYTERYQEAALIRYYEGLETYALPGVARADQYDLWPTRWAESALFVRRARGGDTLPTDRFCADRGSSNVVSERDIDGAPIERWQVVPVRGCGPRRSAAEEAPK
ncbi:MAG: glycosyltransferase family 39 protein [Pseudomonadota bacterium]|nr:glycosyltransferase family 39 protein [Pseudomonadota bacterium]